MEVEHAQGIGITHLYLVNTGAVGQRSEVRKVWFSGGEKGEAYLGVSA